jgi:hypothetical protein
MFMYYRNMENRFSDIQTKLGEAVGLVEPKPNYDWVKWVLFIALLALIGVNVFNYLSQITDWFSKTFGPLFRRTVGSAADVVGSTATQTINTAAEGTQAVVGGVAKGATSGIDELQKAIGGNAMRNNIDNKGIIAEKDETQEQPFVINQEDEEADTSIVGPRTKGLTSGFCYIGEDRGVRSCMQIGQSDKCMSGQIYPTMEVCVNPNLRP